MSIKYILIICVFQQSYPYSPVPSETIPSSFKSSSNNPNAITRNITIGGTPKKIVSTQFNSPIGMYSDATLTEVAEANEVIEYIEFQE